MSSNIFNKTVKELVPDIAQAIYDEIKVPRVGGQRIRVAGFTRDILEGIYSSLEKLLSNKSKELYKICFIAERAGKTVPITPVERVIEYRTIPTIKALVVFDPWKIEEYGRNLFLKYSFRDFPVTEFLQELAERKIASADPALRNAFFAVREKFAGNFPRREKALREALFAHFFAKEDFTWLAFGKNLKFFNAFPDGSLNDKNAVARLKANADLSRLFIYSRLPMKERVLLLAPKDKESATNLLKFFAAKDGVLPEFWLHEIFEKNPELLFDRWCSTHYVENKKPLATSFDGIGKDRRANREIIITWDMPYGREQYGAAYFRIWQENVVVVEHIMRNSNDNRYILDLETMEPGLFQLQVLLSSSTGAKIAESWSAPFWWSGIDLGAPRRPKSAESLSWVHGNKVDDVPSAMYSYLRDNPALKRKKDELIANSARVSAVPFPEGDLLLEVNLPDGVREFIQIPETFKTLERLAIEDLKDIKNYSLDLSERTPALKEEEFDNSDFSEEFMQARKQLFTQLKAAGGSPCSLNLTSIRATVIAYLNAYKELLGRVLKSRAKVIKDEIMFLDTVQVKNRKKVLGIVTLPTHPVELAFRLGYQHLLTNAWQSIFKSSSNNLSCFAPDHTSLRSDYARVLSCADGSHYVLAGVPHPGFSLFLAEEVDFYQLLRKWSRYSKGVTKELLDVSRKSLAETLNHFSNTSAISIAVVGIFDSEGVLNFCDMVSSALPEGEVEFDVTFYGTPAGVIDRTKREVERFVRDYCLHDLSADPEIWRRRFPYDRFRLHNGSYESMESFHVAYVIPNYKFNGESFESRMKCSATFHEGLTTIDVPFTSDMGEVKWSGAGPRKETQTTEKTFEVVEAVNDFFSAAASKISLQKTAAYNHLKIVPAVNDEDAKFARALISNSLVTLCVSLTGSEKILKDLSPDSFSVGAKTNAVAIALDARTSPAGSALREYMEVHSKQFTESLFEELKNSVAVPTTLLRMNDGEKLLSHLITRKALTVLSLTRDGIPIDPCHYPQIFKEGPWPNLILFKFRDNAIVPLMVESMFIRNVEKPEDVELPAEFHNHLDECVIAMDNFFQLLEEEPDDIFSWAKLGEMLLTELKVLCHKNEMLDKDAEAIADNINAVIAAKKSPARDVITQFPLILLPDAKGQLIGRAFQKIHPLCRILSGEEIDQWIKK